MTRHIHFLCIVNLKYYFLIAIGADVYVSNGHKWFYTPKSACFLWVSKSLQPSSSPYDTNTINPVIISNEGKGESLPTKVFQDQGYLA